MSNLQGSFGYEKFGRLESQNSFAFFSYRVQARTWKAQVQFLFQPECFNHQAEMWLWSVGQGIKQKYESKTLI